MTDKHTPGPWAWYGSNHGLYLATTHSGRRHVMGFQRLGMQSAQPTFQEDHRLKPASELVRFAVGDGLARGFKAGRKDPSVYRLDISEIDHPDARLIAAAPELLEALEEIAKQKKTDELDTEYDVECADFEGGYDACIDTARAAIAKARGQRDG